MNSHEGCSGRFTLKKRPELYKKKPACPCCGETESVHSVEKDRRREIQKNLCHCQPYPFPHNKGSLRFCEHHKLRDVEPTDEEQFEYQCCLETPRSG